MLEEEIFLKHASSLLNSSLWNLRMLAITLQTAYFFYNIQQKDNKPYIEEDIFLF